MAEVKEIVDPISVDTNEAVVSRQRRRIVIGIGIGITSAGVGVIHRLHWSSHGEWLRPSSFKPVAILTPDAHATRPFPPF